MKSFALMANGVRDVLANEPFPVVVTNFGTKKVRLKKGQVIGIALPNPAAIPSVSQVLNEPQPVEDPSEEPKVGCVV